MSRVRPRQLGFIIIIGGVRRISSERSQVLLDGLRVRRRQVANAQGRGDRPHERRYCRRSRLSQLLKIIRYLCKLLRYSSYSPCSDQGQDTKACVGPTFFSLNARKRFRWNTWLVFRGCNAAPKSSRRAEKAEEVSNSDTQEERGGRLGKNATRVEPKISSFSGPLALW